MAIVINPITTVILNHTEANDPAYAHFMFKYVLDANGVISLTSNLTGGRFVKRFVGNIKGGELPKPVIQPLVEGKKIPKELMSQIHQFFKDVMRMNSSGMVGAGHGSYEAQAFIVYRNGAYEVVIPPQTVSKASVSYDTTSVIFPNDIIVMDIHSHNNMGAFWSGTDNADDRKNPWISGVFGKVDTTLEYKFRFNDGAGNSYDMVMSDIFESNATSFETPKAWLDKVKVAAPIYTRPQTQTRTQGGYQNKNSSKKWKAYNAKTQQEELNWLGEGNVIPLDQDRLELEELLLGGTDLSPEYSDDSQLFDMATAEEEDALIDILEAYLEELETFPTMQATVVNNLLVAFGMRQGHIDSRDKDVSDLYTRMYGEIRTYTGDNRLVQSALNYIKDTFNV